MIKVEDGCAIVKVTRGPAQVLAEFETATEAAVGALKKANVPEDVAKKLVKIAFKSGLDDLGTVEVTELSAMDMFKNILDLN